MSDCAPGQFVLLRVDEDEFRPLLVVQRLDDSHVRGILFHGGRRDEAFYIKRRLGFFLPTDETPFALIRSAKQGKELGEWIPQPTVQTAVAKATSGKRSPRTQRTRIPARAVRDAAGS